jgi:hypothetical protein
MAFLIYIKKKVQLRAIDFIYKTNKFNFIPSQFDALTKKLDSLQGVLGNYTGYEQITEKKAANGLVLFSYLVKHEKHPLRFTFIFYKPKDHWLIYQFDFDADLIDELKQSEKIYFMQ